MIKDYNSCDRIYRGRYADAKATRRGIFRNGRGRHALPLPSRSPIEVLPGVFSFDPRYLGFLDSLATRLGDDRALQPSVDKLGFVGPNGIHDDFEALRTVPGYSMNPLSYVPVDNSLLCDELGLPDTWRSERHKQIFRNVWRLVFQNYLPSAIKVPKLSTEGFPDFLADAQHKSDFAIWFLGNWRDAMTLNSVADMETLYKRYGVVFAYYLNKREQVDRIGKQRIVFDKEYAATSGKSGRAFAADKSVVLDGVRYDKFSASRSRVVSGGPWKMNFVIQIVATGALHALFETFPKTFHQTDMKKICREQLDPRGGVAFFDVSDYDRTIRDFLLEPFYEAMGEYWDPNVVSWARRAQYASYYSRPLDINDDHGCFFGDPFSGNRQVVCGNRSGNALTSLIAKGTKVAESLCVADDLLGDVLGNEASYLNWERPIAFLNNGDDEGCSGDDAVVSAYVALRTGRRDDGSPSAGYFEVELEKGQVMSGDMIVKSSEGYFPMRRVHTFLQKTFIPERSIGGLFRQFWPLGFFDRVSSYGGVDGHPSYGAVVEHMNAAWRDTFPGQPSITSIVRDAMGKIPIRLDGLTEVDYAVLNDPNKIHYQFTDSDVSNSVMELIVEKIPFERVEPFIRANYGGNIL